MDAALLQGELDARANSAETVVQRTPHFINERLMNFHGVGEIPHGFRYDQPAFRELPALHTFARTDKEKRVLEMFAAFGRFSQAFVLPPGTSEERVRVLKDAFRKSWKDPEYRATVAEGTFALVRRRAIVRVLVEDQASRGVSAGGAELSGAEFMDHGLCPIAEAVGR